MDPDPDPQKNRHTNVITDLDAIALIHQSGRRGPLPRKKKNAPGPRAAPQPVAAVSKPKPASKPATKPAPKAAPSQSTGGRCYQKNSHKIPLYDKSGKKKPFVRSAASLRSKNLDQLLEIVEEYAGAAKMQQYKDAGFTKAHISDWIEAVETRAMPANPNSKLSPPEAVAETQPKGNAKADLNGEPAVEAYTGKGKGKAAAQHQDTSGDAPKDKQPPTKSLGKRKHENAPEPANAPQQTPKKAKLDHENEQHTQQAHADRKHQNRQAKRDARKVRIQEPEKDAEAEAVPTMSKDNAASTKEEATRKATTLAEFITAVGMHTENPDTSSMIVHLPEDGEDRILTISDLKTGKTVIHNTPIPHNRQKRRIVIGQPAHQAPDEPPFLKPGKHGRDGIFADDPDRATGRGHQMTLKDRQGLEGFYKVRVAVRRQYPWYPYVGDGEVMEEGVRKKWEENEKWFVGFAERYGGRAVVHLWDCGCERVGEEDVSEAE